MTDTTMERFLEAEYGGELDDYFKPEVGKYHASTSGSCLRRLYYDFKHEVPPGEDAWPHFELGNRMEDVFERALIEEHGERYVANSIPISIPIDGFEIVGETDIVVLGDNLTVDTLYEVKSTKNLSYVRNKPKWPHVCQLHCYSYGLDLINDESRKIVYIDKGNLETVTHEVDFERGIWNHILRKMRNLHEALMNDEPPEVQPEKHRDYFCPHDDTDRCCKNAVTATGDD